MLSSTTPARLATRVLEPVMVPSPTLYLPGVLTTRLPSVGVLAEPGLKGQDVRDVPVARLRDLVRECHLVLLRGFAAPSSAEELTAWAGSWGEVMTWSADHIVDHAAMPLHWDGMYREHVPEFQIVHCLSGQGGRTTFSDSTRMLSHVDAHTLERWARVEVTYRIPNRSHRGGTAVSPLVVPHPVTGKATLRYHAPPPAGDEACRNRPEREFTGVEPGKVPELVAELDRATTDPRWYYEHEWKAGDLVIADNYTLLHGRTAFTHRAPGHLRRVHVLGEPPFRNPAVPEHQA